MNQVQLINYNLGIQQTVDTRETLRVQRLLASLLDEGFEIVSTAAAGAGGYPRIVTYTLVKTT